ncbi:type IV secretion system protein [Paraburkholderia sp. CNPSo 3076]|uniref:type IV secretion system protein n=1 Tax=Paraburkholderia sp. CNPSo 3076 TaxID=2940936 RepID=UPI002257D239|nr:type IV secretion system protein [Paraburkholderia sp. CNPSo 3076]MCX5545409.1 type IV secretion system protein [Paraburkholderia sp. CNPSo 3076]
MGLKRFLWAFLALCLFSLVSLTARADDTQAGGQQILPTQTGDTISVPSKGDDTVGATVKAGEVAAGAKMAADKFTSLFNAVIPAAVQASQSLKSESDKFAAGLGVITLVLTFVRYSATRDPVKAWVDVFEELATLGIFASIYVGYQKFAPGFFNWFQALANLIQAGAGQGVSASIGAAAGAAFEAVVKAYKGTHWYEYIALTISLVPLLIAYGVLMITSVVFAFMNNLGQIQAAVGIVMGQIAIALGFSSYTRGYFKSWLDYMVSASMYCVISAILSRLVTGSLTSAITAATASGLSTSQGATYVLDLSLFVFLLSFEIPKMAGMFGGGANASGALMKKAASVATGGIL